MDGENFERAIEAYKILRSRLKNLDLCASHGILNREQLKRLRAAGVTSYHHNLETSRRFFPEICTSHTYDERIATIKLAQAEGFCVCSGGIIGMGETWQDRIDLAFELAGLGIESIPVNVLNAIKGDSYFPIHKSDRERPIGGGQKIFTRQRRVGTFTRSLRVDNGQHAYDFQQQHSRRHETFSRTRLDE